MYPSLKSLALCAAAAAMALPAVAQPVDRQAVACSITVDYTRNNILVERYLRDFVVTPDAPFVDDFGTRLRFKQFTATLTRVRADAVVAFDYFNDVGVFHSVGLNGSLKMHGGGIETTTGSQTFAASTGVTPGAVGGNHLTTYTLTCAPA
jgi:hypothetical protein